MDNTIYTRYIYIQYIPDKIQLSLRETSSTDWHDKGSRDREDTILVIKDTHNVGQRGHAQNLGSEKQ